MSLSESLKSKKFDIRMLDWNLKNGVITQQEYDQHMAELADNTANSEKLDFEDGSEGQVSGSAESSMEASANGASNMHGFQH